MKLTVIIVNYNVRYFLQQCLHSVRKASQGLSLETIVVDNNSVDGSCRMVTEEFPDVTLIANKVNTGFSKANNQAIRIAKGEYVLLLNPDTIVQEDTFRKCIQFMDSHPEAGALGVRMIDGKGRFLPESKRGLPTPGVAFYKIFGISKLFPKSRIFNRYHLGHLDPAKTNEAEILSGAFMFMRKKALDEVGLLDESFFMYGEDIDLSHRIVKGGYRNYYFADTTIVHYKGESTKKGSINYVKMFYNAMIIFAHKHYSKKYATYFSAIINLAIYFRAFLTYASSLIRHIRIPATDAALIFTGFYVIKPFWEKYMFTGSGYYPPEYLLFVVPGYVLIWILSLYINSAYDKPYTLSKVMKSILFGALAILAIYALLPIQLRFSRALILIGTGWALLALCLYRILLHALRTGTFRLGEFRKKIVIVGNRDEAGRIEAFLQQTNIKPDIAGWVNVSGKEAGNSLGTFGQLDEIIQVYKIDEIIFSAKDLTAQEIIGKMLGLSHRSIEFKIAPPESLSIIGSNSIHTAGELYLINLNSINKRSNRRKKRIFDLLSALILLCSYPLLFWIYKQPLNALRNTLFVISGKVSWIGYSRLKNTTSSELPSLKPGILSPVEGLRNNDMSEEMQNRANILYAKDYKLVNDVVVLSRCLSNIGKD